MKGLYQKAITRLSSSLKGATLHQMNRNSPLIIKVVKQTFKHDVPYSKLSRLPQSEVKNMLKIPCPLSPNTKIVNPQQHEQIAIYKRLRQQSNVEEGAVCHKCSRKCPLRATPFKQLQNKPKSTNKAALHDLLLYLLALESSQESSYSELRWSAAYKVVTSLEVLLPDFSVLSKESLLFREVLRALEQEERQQLQRNKNPNAKKEEDIKAQLRTRRIRLDSHTSEQ